MSFWKRKRSGNNSGHSGLSLQDDMDFIAQSGGFDAEYYRRQYPEVTGSDRDLLLEYFERGWQQRNPNTWFDTKFYLSVNHDVAEANINPLLHYLRHGKSEGRSCMPGEVGALSPESQKPKSAEPEPGPSDNGGVNGG